MSTLTEQERNAYRAQLNEKFKEIWPKGIPADEFDIVPGSALSAPKDTHTHFTEVKDYITGNKLISGLPIPRFGLLSMKGRNSPMFVYGADCKPFMDISNTGFTDGRHVFVSSLWLRQLMDDETNTNGREQGVVPWTLHQLMHLMRNHTRRLKGFDPKIAERAKDMSIYLDIQKAFGREWEGNIIDDKGLIFSKTIREVEAGFGKTDAATYANLAEETIARLLTTQAEKKKLQQQAQGQGQPQPQNQPGQQGQPQNGQPQPGQGQPGQHPPQGQGQGQPQQGKGQKGGKGQPSQQGEEGEGPWDPMHSVPMEDLAKVLEDNPELSKVKDALGIPDKEDISKIGEIEQKSRLRDLADLQKAMQQKSQLGGKYPGGHIVAAEAERVKADTEGKMHYKLGIRQFISGEGRQYVETFDVPGLLSYVDNADMGLGDNEGVFVPEEIPAQPDAVGLVLLDTSGSVQNEMLSEFLTEIMWLKRNKGEGDTASEIYVFSADTCLRGEPEPITEQNYLEVLDKGVSVYGRGGTDFSTPLKQLMGTKIMKEKKVAFVLYFTDLCASIPKKEDFPANVPVGFICTPNDYSLEFARAVKDWAGVWTMERGTEVDLTEDGFKNGPVDKRPNKGPKRGI
jgi:hypothetical protein